LNDNKYNKPDNKSNDQWKSDSDIVMQFKAGYSKQKDTKE